MTSDNGNGTVCELPPAQLYKFSLKLESTAKGLRIHCHCYGNSSEEVRTAALQLYCETEEDLKRHKLPIAKLEVAP
jgi:hypothetical protein